MDTPHYEFQPINLDAHVLNDRGKTVALITAQGNVDWLLPSPATPGRLLTAITKETHLAHVLGLKFTLHLPKPTPICDQPFRFALLDGGTRALIEAASRSADGQFAGFHRATIALNGQTDRYEWTLETRLRCIAATPVSLDCIEFNNVLPAKTGLGFLQAAEKRFDRTLLVDRDGVVWQFPHQHLMSYTHADKIPPLHFAPGTMGGFFGEELNPVVIVDESLLEPDWAICDMFYDLHCDSRPPASISPGTVYTWRYRIQYFDKAESAQLLCKARLVPVTVADYERFSYPRLELGRNEFKERVRIDDCDEASGFIPQPPEKVWDRQAGSRGKGALRITNATANETVWCAAPPSHIPASRRLKLRAVARTQNVCGKGFFLRVRDLEWRWHPQPKHECVRSVESQPLTGTTQGWVEIEVPELVFTKREFDHMIWIELVLDGTGTGWLTDLNLTMQGVEDEVK